MKGTVGILARGPVGGVEEWMMEWKVNVLAFVAVERCGEKWRAQGGGEER